MFEIAKTFINDNELMEAAAHIGQKIYQQPYTYFRGNPFGANFTYTCSDGTVIHRPNHNIANILRSLHYLGPVLRYFKCNGNNETQEMLKTIDENEIKKILFMQLFYTSGRNSEVGRDTPLVANQARTDAAENFKAYFQEKTNKSPFSDMNEVKRYAQVLDRLYEPSINNKDAALRLILLSCHELDLLRCYPEKRFQASCIDKFNKHSRAPDNRDLQKLLLYVQRCIIATGDMLRTQYQTQDMPGIHEETSFYFQLKRKAQYLIHAGSNYFVFASKGRNDELFKAASRVDKEGIINTCKTLHDVVEPIYVHAQTPNIQQRNILELIESGDAVGRIFNASPSDISCRFEIEQLTCSNYVRPLRKNKLGQPHNIRVDLKTGEVKEYTEREYKPINEQKAIRTPEDVIRPETVSRQEDRGKPKNTVFQKKCSYTLIPKSGIFSGFKGRYQDRLWRDFSSVGFLHDTKKMNLHGEQYIWSEDTKTSGIDGYFWLAKGKDKRPVSYFPGLQTIRDRSHCQNLEELKNKINNPTSDIANYSEILASGSIDSLAAIYATKNDAKQLLAAIYVQCLLRNDYNVERPIIIMDGVNKPRICSIDELQKVVKEAQKKQTNKWSWFLNFFSSPIEIKLLRAILMASDNNPFGSIYNGAPDSDNSKPMHDSVLKNYRNTDASNKQNIVYQDTRGANTAHYHTALNSCAFYSPKTKKINEESDVYNQSGCSILGFK
ncbi:SidE phosphodiesterase domain-containing protein [Legionella feeleii]|uniref:Coiled-coil protein n=1 Tax=Legionella feeleii TaxID=453 RepID=A0A378IQ18_9GAMM|nr:coiled-coil protein [Legionella feeleii]